MCVLDGNILEFHSFHSFTVFTHLETGQTGDMSGQIGDVMAKSVSFHIFLNYPSKIHSEDGQIKPSGIFLVSCLLIGWKSVSLIVVGSQLSRAPWRTTTIMEEYLFKEERELTNDTPGWAAL